MSEIVSTYRQRYILFLMFFGGLGGLLYGYDIGVIAGALLFLHQDITLTTTQTSLIVGAVLGGGAFATLITGPVADYLGRKKTIIISGFIFIVGVLILITAHNFTNILLGRLIQGVGIGMEIVLIPLYLAETTPPQVRGKSVTLFQLFLTLGIVLAFGINIFFAASENWRGMFSCVLVPGVLFFLGSLFIDESPRWLFIQNKTEAALKTLQKTRDEAAANLDLKNMIQTHEQDFAERQHKSSLLQRRYVAPFLIALAIACLNQLTGINSLLQYSTLLLNQSGLSSKIGSMFGTLGIGLMNTITTLITMALIDRVGRKPLLIIGTCGTVLALIFLGLVAHLGNQDTIEGYLLLAGFIFYIMSFGIGPGVVVWLALSELLPTRIRSSGMAICLFANSAVSALLASVFLVIVKSIHLAGAFWLCAGFTLFYFLIATFLLPETKNKSLEEIEQYFSNKSK